MSVDSFKFLPRLIEMFYKMTETEPFEEIPWTPLAKPVHDSTFGLITSAGLYYRGREEPFDLEREQQEPTWGDPTSRMIPRSISEIEIGVSHLHLNTGSIENDVNIVLPLNRFEELLDMDEVGGLAENHFSVMGYQGFPPDTTTWREQTGLKIAEHFKSEGVDCVLLTPA